MSNPLTVPISLNCITFDLMKRNLFIFILVSLGIHAPGQTLDARAELEVEGRINGINVSPDGKLWLVSATGQSYYTASIDSNWHYGPSMFPYDGPDQTDHPSFDRASFFNKDTAFISGYISVVPGELKKNGIYLTSDGGRTWKIVDFGGDSWIYDAFVDQRGHAWMGGSSGDIYFSNDFGNHWSNLKSPFNSTTRMHSIFMVDSNNGVAGALHNQIYITHDNWRTSNKLPTPEDQGKIEVNESSIGERIDAIALWKNRIIVSQGSRIFSSDIEKIVWEPLPFSAADFYVSQNHVLYCILADKHVVKLGDSFQPVYLTKKPLPVLPSSIQVVNNDIYLLEPTLDIIKLSNGDYFRTALYTVDRPINRPAVVAKNTFLTWGLNGSQIYLSRNRGVDWFREKKFDKSFSDILVMTDSLAILWDGNDNYSYSLKDHSLQRYHYENPIQDFLSSKLISLHIEAGSSGCFHHNNSTVSYHVRGDSILSSTKMSKDDYDSLDQAEFENEVSLKKLEKILETVNSTGEKAPSISKFNITERDKKQYLKLLAKQAQGNRDWFRTYKKNERIYLGLPESIDTISSSTIKKALDRGEDLWSTTHNWLNFNFVNANGDTLRATKFYFQSNKPLNLPWRFYYKSRHFNSYEIDLSRFIESCLPKGFVNKEIFANSYFLRELADYLVEEKAVR